MASPKVQPTHARQVQALLDSPEITTLIADLQETRWTGRPGYPVRSMVGMVLVKSLYALPTWTRTARLVAEHAALQEALGDTPSVYACYRFATKLREFGNALDTCIASVLAALHAEHPEMGETVAIDGSDLPAYANGQRFLSKNGPLRQRYSDPDASWGHRSSISTRKGGGYYGYKVHAAVCVSTGLPVAWRVETARDSEMPLVPVLLDAVTAYGFSPTHAVLDKGLRRERRVRGLRGPRHPAGGPAPQDGPCPGREAQAAEVRPRGMDLRRVGRQAGGVEVALPFRRVHPCLVWVKVDRLHTLVPRSTSRWGDLYRQRGAVEREFGRLKHEWALLPLKVRRIERVRLHANMSILTRLTVALDRVRGREDDLPLGRCA